MCTPSLSMGCARDQAQSVARDCARDQPRAFLGVRQGLIQGLRQGLIQGESSVPKRKRMLRGVR